MCCTAGKAASWVAVPSLGLTVRPGAPNRPLIPALPESHSRGSKSHLTLLSLIVSLEIKTDAQKQTPPPPFYYIIIFRQTALGIKILLSPSVCII